MKTVAIVVACLLLVGTGTLAHQPQASSPPQEKPSATSAAPSEGPKPLVPLKVQIVLSRFKGDKKINSLPYMLGVTANERGGKTSLRMGIEVPIVNKNQGYNYRSVGTNIDCMAESAPGGWYKLNMVVEASSVHLEVSKQTEPAQGTPGMASDLPAFRTFNSQFAVLLRDGQTTEYTSAVDPISGEVMKIEVTLNVMK
jgi:hypothetical protein